MNNEQFRKLLAADAAKSSASKNGTSSTASKSSLAPALGSRMKPSIPMTPRSLGNPQADFARQLAERNQATRTKKFKTFAPRGVNLGAGYVDRARDRDVREDDADDRAERLKALEESLKKEEIDPATFEKLRFQIAGGDLQSTHLVKGLDFKLLERVRRGDDVYGDKRQDSNEEQLHDNGGDIDDEFDELEEQEVKAIEREQTGKKKGELSTVTLAPGKKRTRDQILAELKASRAAAKAAKAEASLGSRFRKIGAKQMPGSRIERDSKGREVLIIIDEDGHEKRKVRKVKPNRGDEEEDPRNGLLMPDKDAKPLGMEVPEHYKVKEKSPEVEEDVDIFDDVGDDYDPLAGMDSSDSDSGSDSPESETKKSAVENEGLEAGEVDGEQAKEPSTSTMQPQATKPTGPRDYFRGSKTGLLSSETIKAPSASDPSIMAAIKRAAALNPISDQDSAEAKEAKALEERRKKLLQMTDRDDEDIDMGFGTSRFEDEEDFDDKKVKLSVWGQGGGDGDDDGGKGRGGGKRKRGPKKRKGDANNAADVLRVMEQRKGKGS